MPLPKYLGQLNQAFGGRHESISANCHPERQLFAWRLEYYFYSIRRHSEVHFDAMEY